MKYALGGERMKQSIYMDDVSIPQYQHSKLMYSTVSDFDQMTESIYSYINEEDDILC